MAVADKHDTTLSDSLKLYPGEWVAIRNLKVVDHAPTLRKLRERTAGQQIDRFFGVPPRKRGGGIFL